MRSCNLCKIEVYFAYLGCMGLILQMNLQPLLFVGASIHG